MNLYDENGYLNWDAVHALNVPFVYIVGGRGIGKTFGALKYYTFDNPHKYIYMRRTDSNIKMLMKPSMDPTKALNRELGCNLAIYQHRGDIAGIYPMDSNSDGQLVPVGDCYGNIAALSTLAGKRGFDGEQYEVMILDEFIAERHERPIKSEDDVFYNAYETINRNRELKGRPALRCICMANSNNIANPIFASAGLIKIAVKMKQERRELYVNRQRGIAIINCEFSPISQAKKETSLYKMIGEKHHYTQMSTDNSYNVDTETGIRSMPIREYRPIVRVGEICIYQHKSTRDYYVSNHAMTFPATFPADAESLRKFNLKYRHIFTAFLMDRVTFEEYALKVAFLAYFGS